jgi:MFS family permease
VSEVASVTKEILSDRNILVVTGTNSFFSFFRNLYTPWWSLFLKEEMGASLEIVALLAVFQQVSGLVFQLPGGILADRFGRKYLTIIGASVRTIAMIIYYFASSWEQIVPGLVIMSFASMGSPGFQSMIAESLPSERRATGYGVYRALTQSPLVFATLLGGVLMDSLGLLPGMRVCFLGFGLISSISVVMRLRFITETLSEEEKRAPESMRSCLSNLVTNRSLMAMLITACLASFAIRLSNPFIVIYVTEVIGLTKTEWAIIEGATMGIAAVLTIPGGILADRVGRRPFVIFARLAVFLSNLIYIFVRGFYPILLLRMVAAIGLGFGGGLGGAIGAATGGAPWQSLQADLTTASRRGRTIGIMGTLSSLCGLPASTIGAILWQVISPESALTSTVFVGVIPILVFYKFVIDPRFPKRKTISP